MLALPRQQIAEVFLALLLLVIISGGIAPAKKTALSLVYGSALVVSHYSLSYFFIYLLLFSLLLFSLGPLKHHLKRITRGGAARHKINLSQQEQQRNPNNKGDRNAVSLGFILFKSLILALWFKSVLRKQETRLIFRESGY
jgi:hypothetical protein